MRAWIAAVAMVLTVPAAAAAQEDYWTDDPTRLQAAITQMRESMLRPGEQVAGWDRGGVDPDAEVRRLGADRFYMLNRTSEDGTSVTIITDRPIRDFAPAGWRIVDSFGQGGERLDAPQVDFQPLSARYIFASRGNVRRVNDATCYGDFSHALLYEVPGAAASPDDEMIPAMFRIIILALEGQTVCMRNEGDRTRGYTSQFFLPDGRRLPELDEPGRLMTIVPAAPVDRLIAPPAPRPAGGAPTES